MSLERGIPGVSCREIVQRLWGKEAGGHDNIAGSPRGKRMDEREIYRAAEVLNDAIKESREAGIDSFYYVLSE